MVYLYSFLSCAAFCVLYNVRGIRIFYAALGGALGKFIYEMAMPFGMVVQFFISAVVVALYSELMARVSKCPVMIFLIVAVLPLVPGAAVYHTMESLYEADMAAFYQYGNTALLGSGSIAFAILIVSSTVRIFKIRRLPKKFLFAKEPKFLQRMR